MNVAVIMRTKDRPLLLGRAIDSLIAQTYKNWELVLVNDGGDRESIDKILDDRRESLKGRYQFLHNETSRGRWVAANQAIEASDSRYVALLDDDDTFEPEYLEKTAGFLDGPHDPRFKGVITNFRYIKEEIRENKIVTVSQDPPVEFGSMSLLELFDGHPSAQLVHERGVYQDIGGCFRTDMQAVADWEFMIRYLLSYEIWVVKRPLFNYHIRQTNSDIDYGNSILQDYSMMYQTAVKNEYIRKDILEGRYSVGQLLQQTEFNKLLIGTLNKIDKRLENLDRYAYRIANILKGVPYVSRLFNSSRQK